MSDLEKSDKLSKGDKLEKRPEPGKLATITNDDLYPIMDSAVEFIIRRLIGKYKASKFACRHFHDTNRLEVCIDYLQEGRMGTFQYSIDLKQLQGMNAAFFEGQLDVMIDKHFEAQSRKLLHGKEIEE